MSRPRGSGLAVSKSISESASSTGSDFLYPTAFMPVVSKYGAIAHGLIVAPAHFWQVPAWLSLAEREQEQPRLLLDWQGRLERHLGSHCKRVEFRSGIANVGRADLLCDVAVQVVEQESDVSIDIPVQGRGVDRLAPTGDAGRGGKLIVEVYRADTAGNLQRAPAAARQRERMLRYHAQIGCRGRIVLAGF